MVTLNNELQEFYNSVNGKISEMNTNISKLIKSIDDLKTSNTILSNDITSNYTGDAQALAAQSLTNLSSNLTKISSGISDKLQYATKESQTILDMIKELNELKSKIDNEEDSTNDENTFNSKQSIALNKLIELKKLDNDTKQGTETKQENEVEISEIVPGTYKQYTYTASNGVKVEYYAYVPSNITATEGLPIHLHLWPSRDKGPMGYFNVHGLPKILYEGGSASGVVICPKIQAKESYTNEYLDALKELSDSYVKKYKCDSSRISVSGQGGGGQAALNFATKYPDYFSNVVSLYTIDTTKNYDEIGVSNAKANLTKNNVTIFKCTGGGDNLDARSANYTNQLYKELSSSSNVKFLDNPHYIYGDDLFSKPYTYNGKTYKNLLEYCLSQKNSNINKA